MKIRTGFVSNSSSSSFCLIGDPISEEDIFSSKSIPGQIMVVGGQSGNGIIVFELTSDMRKKLRSSIVVPYCKGKNMQYLKNSSYYEDGSLLGGKHTSNSIVCCGTADQNSIDKDTFERVYIKGDLTYGVELY